MAVRPDHEGTTEVNTRPNIVLVHGAWADGSSWSGVIERLQADGYHVTAPQLPLTALADDVARLRQVLDLQDGPAIVAGHSYRGQGRPIRQGQHRSEGCRLTSAISPRDRGTWMGGVIAGSWQPGLTGLPYSADPGGRTGTACWPGAC